MIDDFLKHSQARRARREAYAHAIVIRHGKPISGKPGDKAIIGMDGVLHGWIGGGCTHPVVVKEALQALQEGKPRLVAINPSGSVQPIEDFSQYPMSCQGGGALDIYIEPVMPNPLIVILGASPVGLCLSKLALEIGYSVAVSEASGVAGATYRFPENDLGALPLANPCFLVVSTQGEDDELALQAALQTTVPYVAFVGSRQKSKALKEYLQREGVTKGRLETLRTPAGLDLGARTPGEIALSVLAEIIQLRRDSPTEMAQAHESLARPLISEDTVDPVCGMTVTVAAAKHTSRHNNETYYFCCGGCRTRFEAEPEKFLAQLP
ncbi:MAG: XdhC family protein [SAR324 cluster bacterium]|nr:XdhC family protein [SAR324 cluster bacterium]